jgi:hypothetical protein
MSQPLSDREWTGVRRVFRPFSRASIDAEVREEFRFHIEEPVEQFVADGMSRADAEVEVRRRFGNVDATGCSVVFRELRAESYDQPSTEAVFYASTPIDPKGEAGRNMNELTYVVRTDGIASASLIPAMQKTMAELNPRVPVIDARLMDHVVARSMARTSFIMTLLLRACASSAEDRSRGGAAGELNSRTAEDEGIAEDAEPFACDTTPTTSSR